VGLHVRIRHKGFAGRTVLQNLSFTLPERQIVALVGPSGCGKTTLLRIVAGLDTAFEGSITFHDRRPPRVGMVFQEPRLLPWRTVTQNLALFAPEATQASIEALARTLDIWPFRNAFPPSLSLGTARRVAIARAFAVEPELVLLDEPFVSLDAELAERSRRLLTETWRQRAVSVLLVTHDLTEAVTLADRILVMSTGPSRIVSELVVPEEERRRPRTEAASLVARLQAMAFGF
jgi:sulfonate transport system ATP-binding protein